MDTTPTGKASRDQAAEHLASLEQDRGALEKRAASPNWLYPTLGIMLALFAISPVLNDGGSANFLVTGIAVLGLLWLANRERGIRFTGKGVVGNLYLVGILALVLLMLSVSFGIAASAHWAWLGVPAVLTFVGVTALGRAADRAFARDAAAA